MEVSEGVNNVLFHFVNRHRCLHTPLVFYEDNEMLTAVMSTCRLTAMADQFVISHTHMWANAIKFNKGNSANH